MRRILTAFVLLPFALLAAVGPSQAAKPAAPVYSIALDQPAPSLGDVVTFTLSGEERLSNPLAVVRCYQDGRIVYGENGPESYGFKLGGDSSRWLLAGGTADCTAQLADYRFKGGKWSITYYAETSFAAAG